MLGIDNPFNLRELTDSSFKQFPVTVFTKLNLFDSVKIERLKVIERNTADIGTNQYSEEGNGL